MTTKRGIRNNNPGNIRLSKDKWQGLAKSQTDPEFFRFESPKWGIRALCRVLITYQDDHGCKTIRDFISRWAPPGDNNDTESYIRSVGDAMNRSTTETLNVHRYDDLAPLVNAIIKQENGQNPYTQAEMDAALVLAGVEPVQRSLQTSRTIQGSQVAAAATAVGMAAQAGKDYIPVLQSMIQYVPWVFGALALVGIGWVVWARIDDRRRGLR